MDEQHIEEIRHRPLVRLAHWFLDLLNVDKTNELVTTIVMIAIAIVISSALFWITKSILHFLLRHVNKHTQEKWGIVISEKLITRFSLLPPLFSMMAFGFAIDADNVIYHAYIKIVYLAEVVCVAMFLATLIDGIFENVALKYPKSRSLQSIKQLVVMVVYFLMIIVFVAVVIGKSPQTLLAGIGASAAVMSLIFKETITSLVSGVQLSANKMLAPGDWIVAPKHNANGTVIEVNLNTVKIRNWDNSVTTIPPGTLMQDSFTNWKNMLESKGRRISRSVNIDMDAIRFVSAEELDKFAQEPSLANFVSSLGTAGHPAKDEVTNLMLFREYMYRYLLRNSNINHPIEGTTIKVMVRYLQPTQFGMPVEVYCFSKNKKWEDFEQIQADITDFMIASMQRFGLRVYQVASDRSVKA